MALPEPHVPPAVVEWLEGLFPDKLPSRRCPEAELGELVGEQNVVRKMRSVMERQQNNVLKE